MQGNEFVINSWKINYSNQNGAKLKGILTVTNKRLLFDAPFNDTSKKTLDQSLLFHWDKKDYIIIAKHRIKEISVAHKFFMYRVIIILDNDSKHTFNYSVLNINPVIEAIKKS